VSRTLEEQCAHLVETIRVWAYHQYRRDGGSVPLEEYIEAGLDALCRCWARFDATRGLRFQTYAEHRIQWAIQEAAGPYQTWHRVHIRYRGAPELPHADLLRRRQRGPEEKVAEAEALENLVAQLPAPLQPYAWHVLMGGTQAEYAARVGWTEGTVATWLYAYRQQYRQGQLARPTA
jgi:hypothetical protein